MKVFVAGEREDVAGFGLAGAEPISLDDLARADPNDSVVILSSSVAELPNRRIDESTNRRLFVVLPEP